MNTLPLPACDVCGLPMEDATWQQKRHPGECHRAHERERRRRGRSTGRHAATYEKRGPWSGPRACWYCLCLFDAKSPRASVCYAQKCQRQKHADRQRLRRRAASGVPASPIPPPKD